MLKSLYIRNYAIIEEVHVEFDDKLTIITGETGAGKSIILGAMGLILGNRADTSTVATGAEKCIVEGTFDLDKNTYHSFFSENELDWQDQCIIRREVTTSGKSRSFINDTPVTLQQLKLLTELLVDIVSQHETLSLNDAGFQLSIVDSIAGTLKSKSDFENQYNLYHTEQKKLQLLLEQEQKLQSDEDYRNFILQELSEANLSDGEQEEIEQRISLLSNAEMIREHAYQSVQLLTGSEQNMVDMLQRIKSDIDAISTYTGNAKELSTRIESCLIELKDISVELDGLSETVDSDPAELERLNERLTLILHLQKKHKLSSISELNVLKENLHSKNNQSAGLSEEIAETQKKLNKLFSQLKQQASELSKKRADSIAGIEKNLMALLKKVYLPDASIRLEHHVLDINAIRSNGMDEMKLMFTPNKGSKEQPLHKIASGGELSRLMLCIKSLISNKVKLPTIIFDEIDTGISGEAALKVSQVMKQLSTNHQVISITHLPQIAAKADKHFYVYKQSDKTTTKTYIRQLNETERVEEIARMLHGENPSAKVLDAAKELIG